MTRCEIIAVNNLSDVLRDDCENVATGQCSDCGTPVCEVSAYGNLRDLRRSVLPVLPVVPRNTTNALQTCRSGARET